MPGGLSAIATVDCATGRMMGVKFLARRARSWVWASTSLARRVLFLSHAGVGNRRPKRAHTDHGVAR